MEQPAEDSSDSTTILNIGRRPFMKLTGAGGGAAVLSNTALATDHDAEDSEEEIFGEDDNLPHVHIIGTGGTIANPDEPGYLTPEELLEARPELQDVAQISLSGVSELGSSQLTPGVLYELYNGIMDVAEELSPDGIVVTHGSNTIEETTYFLNLALKTEIPVVGTAAQRGVDALGTDSDKNLYDAVRTAAEPDSSGRGVLFVANDEIHHARDVTKVVSSRPDGWVSPNFGRVGLAESDGIHFYRDTERTSYPETQFDISGTTAEEFPLQDIEIVYSALGTTGRMVDAGVEAGAIGFVDATLPTGSSSRPDGERGQEDALADAAEQGIPVILSQRSLEGKITGDESVVGADTLSPQKARLLLAFGIMEDCDTGELQELFDTY